MKGTNDEYRYYIIITSIHAVIPTPITIHSNQTKGNTIKENGPINLYVAFINDPSIGRSVDASCFMFRLFLEHTIMRFSFIQMTFAKLNDNKYFNFQRQGKPHSDQDNRLVNNENEYKIKRVPII